MTAHDVEKTVCHRCFAVLDASDRFCRHCGVPTAGSAEGYSAAARRPLPGRARPKRGWSRGMILLMLFVLLGPLAYPMLWQSPKFSRFWKIVLTVLVIVASVLAVWLCWYLLEATIVKPLMELRNL